MLTDPIADMLSRIRNANRALHDTCQMPNSKMKEQIARLLKEEGYIRDYHVETAETWNDAHPDKSDHRSYNTLVIDLKFGRNRERVITNLKRISKPGRRVYARKDRLPRVLGGMGVAILSTSNGLVTGRTAEERGIGGEVVAFIW
jgi:small subunit ribosomal protein S8